MPEVSEIAVIGAGPYGLSTAAHLAGWKIPHRIFGKAMETWATQMPKGMHLKSDGYASSLYDPQRSFTFGHYCRERNIPYADLGVPPRREDFVDYGRAFQRSLAPHLEDVMVSSLERDGDRYRLQFDTGGSCLAKTVVVAAGISHFAVLPETLSGLPQDLVTHSSAHHDLSEFKGRKVVVIGAGSSAADMAGLLHEAGAETHIVTRRSEIPFHTKMQLPRPLFDQLRNPSSKIGPGWRSVFFTTFPHLFARLPEDRRLRVVRGYLGPAPGYFMRDRVLGKVNVHYGLEVLQAKPSGRGVNLTLSGKGGEKKELEADHVICGTGYKSELARLPFLGEPILSQIRAVQGTPILSGNFESSLPGLFFVGAIAANTFGPVLRFACGAEFAAPRVARHLSRRHRLRESSIVTGVNQSQDVMSPPAEASRSLSS